MSRRADSHDLKPIGTARRELLRLAGLGLSAFAITTSPGALAAQRLKAKTEPRRLPLIVIDPGHGGIDPGCIGYSGSYEKDVTISAGHLIAARLEASGRYRVMLTRTDDRFVELHQRVVIARAAAADLFLSVHADAIPNEAVRGASVFTLSEKASDAQAAALAERENRADQVAGIKLATQSSAVSSILIDLARRQTNNLSVGLARELVAKLGSSVRMLENSHRSAGFAVLKAPDIPSALVEMGCLSNQDEERMLSTSAYRQKVANGIAASIDAYWEQVVRT